MNAPEDRAITFAPGMLWVLWNIVKSFQPFHVLTSAVMGGMSLVEGAVNHLSPLPAPPNDAFDAVSADAFYAALEIDCSELGLAASLATVKKIRESIEAGPSYRAISPLLVELQGRLLDEMKEKTFWALDLKETRLFSSPRDGWERIIDRFPDAVTDVEEASKCLAFSRYAAAVFHSVKVVEAGLIELGTFIGVTDPRSGWTAVTNQLSKVLKREHSQRTDFEKANFEFLEQVHATVEGLKNAWRNKISHTQGRLVLMSTEFSPDIAEEILFASRAFMRRLADGLPRTSK